MDVVLVLLGVVAAFYFILLRPVIKQQRKQRSDISRLQPGDEVLTSGGFYATVIEINTYDDAPMEILLEVAPDVVLHATTLAIQEVVASADEFDDAPDDATAGDDTARDEVADADTTDDDVVDGEAADPSDAIEAVAGDRGQA